MGTVGKILDITMDEYQEIFDVNVTATVHLTKLCLSNLRTTDQFQIEIRITDFSSFPGKVLITFKYKPYYIVFFFKALNL